MWSTDKHAAQTVANRSRALDVLYVGYQLAGGNIVDHAHYRAFLDVWVDVVMPHALVRPHVLQVDSADGGFSNQHGIWGVDNRSPIHMFQPYKNPPHFVGQTIFDVGPQGQGLWTFEMPFADSLVADMDVSVRVADAKTVWISEIRLFGNPEVEYMERFPEQINVYNLRHLDGDEPDVYRRNQIAAVTVQPTEVPSQPPDYYRIDLRENPVELAWGQLTFWFKGNFTGRLLANGMQGNSRGAIELLAMHIIGSDEKPDTKLAAAAVEDGHYQQPGPLDDPF